MKSPKRVVVISFGAIGEALMFLALLDVVHNEHPSTECEFFAARQGALPEQLGKEYGFIRFSNLKSTLGILRVFRLMFSRNIVLVPPSYGTVPLHVKAFAFLLSRVLGSISVGFTDKSGFHPYTMTRSYRHEASFFTNLLEALQSAGVRSKETLPSYRPHPVDGLLPKLNLTPGKFAVIHPFAANKKRGLPVRRWKSLVEYLSRTYPDMTLCITGGKDDKEVADAIAKQGARSYAGVLTLPETAALIKEAVLFIGVDTGITHLASLMRIPSVVIGNRSNPTWLPTYNKEARILTNATNCGCTGDKKGECGVVEDGQEYLRCAYDISDSAIETAVRDALSRTTE